MLSAPMHNSVLAMASSLGRKPDRTCARTEIWFVGVYNVGQRGRLQEI